MQQIFGRLVLTGIVVLGTACSETPIADSLAPVDPTMARATGGSALGSKLVFVSGRDMPTADPFIGLEIYSSNADGTNPIRLTNTPLFSEILPTWSPNGQEIVFDSNEGFAPRNEKNLYVMNDDGSERRLLTHGTSASWSPNGKQIAFHDVVSLIPADSDIFVIDADGTGRTNLTSHPGFDTDADWSPNGRTILFTSTRHGGTNIYVMNADGSDVTQLTFDAVGENAGPDWSPNGKRIVFMRRYPGHPRFEIYVMDADGSDPVRLTFNNALDATPTWSPDGKQIVFHTNRDGGPPQLYMMNADGSDQHALTTPPGRNQWANWGNGHLDQPGHPAGGGGPP